MGYGGARKRDNLVRQEEMEFVIAHTRWTFDWCTQDKQIFSRGIDTDFYWWSMKPLYIYINVCIKRERVTILDQLIQVDIFLNGYI